MKFPPTNVWDFLLIQILWEPRRAILPRVRRKFLKSLTLHIVARVARTPQFLALITPLHPTSSGQFQTLYPFLSISRDSFSYRSTFLFRASSKPWALSNGTVNSRRTTLPGETDLSTMTMSVVLCRVHYNTMQSTTQYCSEYSTVWYKVQYSAEYGTVQSTVHYGAEYITLWCKVQ